MLRGGYTVNFALHALTAVPFVVTDNLLGAVACVAPDLTWVSKEFAYRRSALRPWPVWAATLRERDIAFYRVTHSIFPWLACAWVVGDISIAVGALLHIGSDLPTHGGLLTQQPLYPLRWRWPWPKK